MNDIDLLIYAAKAAGIQLRTWGGLGCWSGEEDQEGFLTMDGDRWNPLTDDGDAFRLAAALFPYIEYVMDEWPDEKAGVMRHKVNMPATCRFIVEAAAKIGKEML